jgi:hypothetical protein
LAVVLEFVDICIILQKALNTQFRLERSKHLSRCRYNDHVAFSAKEPYSIPLANMFLLEEACQLQQALQTPQRYL